MKTFAIVGAAALGLLIATPVLAADLAVPAAAPAAAAPAPAASWTGAYVGIQGGYVWGSAPSPDQGWEVDPTGGLIGAFAGYNYDLGGVVIGAEVGGNWDFATGSVVTNPLGGTETFKADQNWDASLVGRIGVPVADSFLLYGLAGGSITQVSGAYDENPPPNDPTVSTTVGGWTVGAGAEYKLTDMFSVRGEYRYASYGNADLTCSFCGHTSVNLSTNAATIGLLAHW